MVFVCTQKSASFTLLNTLGSDIISKSILKSLYLYIVQLPAPVNNTGVIDEMYTP